MEQINDYEDAVVEQVARRFSVESIVTHNQKDYELGCTKVFNLIIMFLY